MTLSADLAIVAVEMVGTECLFVRYDRRRTIIPGGTEVARGFPETDRHNPTPVAMRYGVSALDSRLLRRDPARTPMVDTEAGIK
ncbi:MAG: hypothetical protein ACYCS7_09975 [Acidimicrobiales bacterium]